MKLIAINEIHYTGKDGKPAVAVPGSQFDVPQALADTLLIGAMPSARRMTDAEIELDKLRALAMTKGKSAPEHGPDDEDDEDDEDSDDAAQAGTNPEVKTEAKGAKPVAKTPAKGSAKDY